MSTYISINSNIQTSDIHWGSSKNKIYFSQYCQRIQIINTMLEMYGSGSGFKNQPGPCFKDNDLGRSGRVFFQKKKLVRPEQNCNQNFK